MIQKIVVSITAFFIALSAMTIALAETAPEDAAEYRHTVMGALGSHTHALAMIFTGKVDEPDQLVTHADAIAAIGAEIGTLFPAGSNVDDSHALPLVWEEPEQFARAVSAAEAATAGIAEAAASGDRGAVGKAFKALGEACKGCHDVFRAEDDH